MSFADLTSQVTVGRCPPLSLSFCLLAWDKLHKGPLQCAPLPGSCLKPCDWDQDLAAQGSQQEACESTCLPPPLVSRFPRPGAAFGRGAAAGGDLQAEKPVGHQARPTQLGPVPDRSGDQGSRSSPAHSGLPPWPRASYSTNFSPQTARNVAVPPC